MVAKRTLYLSLVAVGVTAVIGTLAGLAASGTFDSSPTEFPPMVTPPTAGGAPAPSPTTAPTKTGTGLVAPDPNFRDPTSKCFMVKGFHATWQSGATVASLDPLPLCGDGNAWTLTLKRPSGQPGLETDQEVARRIRIIELDRQIDALRGEAAMAAGLESLGSALGCLAAGGGCSSFDTSYSYSPPARTAKPVRTYQEENKTVYEPPLPDLNLDLGLPLGKPTQKNRCPITSPYYLTPSCRGE